MIVFSLLILKTIVHEHKIYHNELFLFIAYRSKLTCDINLGVNTFLANY